MGEWVNGGWVRSQGAAVKNHHIRTPSMLAQDNDAVNANPFKPIQTHSTHLTHLTFLTLSRFTFHVSRFTHHAHPSCLPSRSSIQSRAWNLRLTHGFLWRGSAVWPAAPSGADFSGAGSRGSSAGTPP